jgi:hypothetical protein
VLQPDTAAQEACDALKHREPRIALLFGRYTPVHRNAWLAYLSLSMAAMSLTLGPQETPEKQESEHERRWEEFGKGDEALRNFSRQAREAILEPSWSVRRFRQRLRTARANWKAKRRNGTGGEPNA